MREWLRGCGADGGILAAVSGGADSVCLLVLLAELSSEMGFRLEAVHVHHGLRGEAADGDEAWVRELCSRLGVRLTCLRADVASLARREHLGTEEAGRKARYDAFYKTAVERSICNVAVAHNLEDNAETVLYRLARGTGLRGMTGIPAVRELPGGIRVIRPLLGESRQAIREELRARGISWREDATNAEEIYARNVIRAQVLPVLEDKINEKAAEHIAQAARFAGEAQAYLEEEARRAVQGQLQREKGQVRIPAELLTGLPPVIAKTVIRQRIEEVCPGIRDVAAVHLEAVLDLCGQGTGKGVSLPGGARAERSYENLVFTRAEEEAFSSVKLTVPGEYPLPGGRILTLAKKRPEKGETFPKSSCEKWFDYATINDAVFLRTAQEEDYLICDREGHKKSLNRWFIDEKIPRAKRAVLPILACGHHVLWVIGCRASLGGAVTETTQEVLLVKVSGEDGDLNYGG